MDPAIVTAGLPLLTQFLVYLLNSAPSIFPIVRDFWGANNLGPMPPDLDAWARVDDEIDAARAKQKDTPIGTVPK